MITWPAALRRPPLGWTFCFVLRHLFVDGVRGLAEHNNPNEKIQEKTYKTMGEGENNVDMRVIKVSKKRAEGRVNAGKITC